MSPLLFCLLSLSAPANAAELVSPDGTYALTAPEELRLEGDALVGHNDQYEIRLLDSRVVDPAAYKAELDLVVKKTDAGAVASSWTGTLRDGRAGACVDTRGAIGFKVKLNAFCLIDIGGGRAGLLRMTTRNVVKVTEYSDALQDLLDRVRATGAAPAHSAAELAPDPLPPEPEVSQPVLASEWYRANPENTSSSGESRTSSDAAAATPADTRVGSSQGSGSEGTGSSSPEAAPAGPSLKALGYACAQGRWNSSMSRDDLQVWWKPQTRELVAHFTVMDGPEAISFTLGGVVEVGPPGTSSAEHQELFGHLDLREGPTTSVSGIHRLFQGVDVQGTIDGGLVSAFRTTQDENFTRMGACGSS